LSIGAVGDRVVVKEGASRWVADSGQYLLLFEGDPDAGSLCVMEQGERAPSGTSSEPSRSPRTPLVQQGETGRPADASEWFDKGVALEKWDIAAAVHAYGQAIAADPALVTARINLGGLLHEAGRHAEAERVYRDAIAANSTDAVLFYNLGVLLEDMKRKTEAIAAYLAALRRDPDLADCHYNLALLCAELKKPKDAIRHMAQYRKLTEKDSR
jgi:tetratricopeptide (TPR) repeat protein